MTSLVQLPISPDSVETTEIPFGEWLPDLPTRNNPGALEAMNVLPNEGAYTPFPQLVTQVTGVLPEEVSGAAAIIRDNDIVQLYAGSRNKIYVRAGGASWEEVFSGATSADTPWKFIRVNDVMVALHPDQFPQRNPAGTNTAFVVVGGSPPRAKAGAQVGDFLMLGNLLEDPDDGGDPFPSRVRWSGFNNIDASWITDPATQADFQDLPAEGGPVVAIIGREVGTIFQARMISRASYRGPPTIFDFVVVEDKRGCIARDCVVDVGPFSYFIAEDGFFVWNGTNSQPIGDGKVNRYFFKRLQWSRRNRIVGAHDPVNGCVVWAFPTGSSGLLGELIIYSYRENRWSHSDFSGEYLFTSAASNITLDDLTDPIESYDYSFDSPSLRTGGRERLAAFDPTHAYGLFTGSAMAATLETGDYSAPDGRRVFVNNARPLVDVFDSTLTMQSAARNQLVGDVISYGETVAQEIDGTVPIIADARYMRFRVNIPVNTTWNHATGVEVWRKPTGSF